MFFICFLAFSAKNLKRHKARQSGGSSRIWAKVQLMQTCFLWCVVWPVLGRMLHTLFRKSKATEVSGVQEEMCNLPTWAKDSQMMSVASGLARYASPLNRVWGDRIVESYFPQI